MSQLSVFLPIHPGLREQRGNLVDINSVYGELVLSALSSKSGWGGEAGRFIVVSAIPYLVK